MQDKSETHITLVHVSETNLPIPDFALEPEGLWTKLSEISGGKDLDFAAHPIFSKKYYLRGENEVVVREFFTSPIIDFLENREQMHIECHKHRLIFYKKRDLLEPAEILYVSKFAEEFLQLVQQTKSTQPA